MYGYEYTTGLFILIAKLAFLMYDNKPFLGVKMKVFSIVSLLSVLALSGCSQNHDNVIVTKVPLGKITSVYQKKDAMFVVRTSSGQIVYTKSLAMIKTDLDATLVVTWYSSGKIARDICIQDDCVSLLQAPYRS
jgi:hypothetical protein